MNIEFEATQYLKEWLKEFDKEENAGKVVLSNIPYSYYEIAREIIRRENLEP